MNRERVAKILLVAMVALPFIDILTTVPFVDDPRIIELNPFVDSAWEILITGIPFHVAVGVFFILAYTQLFAKGKFKEVPYGEEIFLATLAVFSVIRGVMVVSNTYQLFRFWGLMV